MYRGGAAPREQSWKPGGSSFFGLQKSVQPPAKGARGVVLPTLRTPTEHAARYYLRRKRIQETQHINAGLFALKKVVWRFRQVFSGCRLTVCRPFASSYQLGWSKRPVDHALIPAMFARDRKRWVTDDDDHDDDDDGNEEDREEDDCQTLAYVVSELPHLHVLGQQARLASRRAWKEHTSRPQSSWACESEHTWSDIGFRSCAAFAEAAAVATPSICVFMLCRTFVLVRARRSSRRCTPGHPVLLRASFAAHGAVGWHRRLSAPTRDSLRSCSGDLLSNKSQSEGLISFAAVPTNLGLGPMPFGDASTKLRGVFDPSLMSGRAATGPLSRSTLLFTCGSVMYLVRGEVCKRPIFYFQASCAGAIGRTHGHLQPLMFRRVLAFPLVETLSVVESTIIRMTRI